MNFKHLVLIIILIQLISAKKKDSAEKCTTCDNLISNFADGLKKTQKGNFGGGNTDWEDRKLGNYLTSETRFEEIIETVCSESDCHNMLELIEDKLLVWFKKHQKLENFAWKLKEQICIKDLKHCCPEGTHGPTCTACPKNLIGLICSGNGRCLGEGKRSNGDNDGKCECNLGYTGDLCQECRTDFYYTEYKNETHTKCSECHQSCKECSGPNVDSCLSCRDGWSMNENTKLCEDINECLVKERACNEDQFCENSQGSYICHDCDKSCTGCTGAGNNKCIQCKQGYKSSGLLSQTCEDVNECEETPSICGENKKCINRPGSFECKENVTLNQSNHNVNNNNNKSDSSISKNDNNENGDEDEDDEEDDEKNNQIKSEL